jgi:hypothetical protein
MNSTGFEKWMQEKLIPNLPENIVSDNSPYNCIKVNKPVSKYAVKADMISWLRRQRMACDAGMRQHSR